MKKILLLEDEYELGETLEELLVDNGYDVVLVHIAQDAICASYEGLYDLYIFDINLPDMSGFDLLKSLRDAYDKTPAIFISALIDINSISKGFEVGANDYLKKPFFPQELLIRVDAKFAETDEIINYNNLIYFPALKELRIDDKLIVQGEVQKCLCDIFMHNIGNILDKSILIDCLLHPSDAALRVALNKLKHSTNLPIKNIRGVGYILEKS